MCSLSPGENTLLRPSVWICFSGPQARLKSILTQFCSFMALLWLHYSGIVLVSAHCTPGIRIFLQISRIVIRTCRRRKTAHPAVKIAGQNSEADLRFHWKKRKKWVKWNAEIWTKNPHSAVYRNSCPIYKMICYVVVIAINQRKLTWLKWQLIH